MKIDWVSIRKLSNEKVYTRRVLFPIYFLSSGIKSSFMT